jgi:hypothetical protein
MLQQPLVYQIQDLASARKFLSEFSEPIIITNTPGSTRYYGMLILDYIFKNLTNEFPQIIKIIIDVGDDHPALFTALKLNYQHILYKGKNFC